jgi:hypothetical protein
MMRTRTLADVLPGPRNGHYADVFQYAKYDSSFRHSRFCWDKLTRHVQGIVSTLSCRGTDEIKQNRRATMSLVVLIT